VRARLFRTLESWIRTQPADRHPFHPDLTGFEIEKLLGLRSWSEAGSG
jgi:hypothetical protein